MTTQPRIFVQIASYRDPECQWTVKDLFEKASAPERISVGICWQFDAERDRDCFEVPCPRPQQVRVINVPHSESRGVCWARAQVQTLWQGEEFTLQIDAHTRFVAGWDEVLLRQLRDCDSARAVISCNPPAYEVGRPLDEHPPQSVRRANPFDATGNLRFAGMVLNQKPPKPLKGAFVAARFWFASSEIIEQIPYDPWLYVDQEDVTMALRFYTHGWDVFSPSETVLYHLYFSDQGPGHRRLHWREHPEAALIRNTALARFNHLTGHRPSTTPDVLLDIDRHGLGDQRSLAQFELFTGIDFQKKQVSHKALACRFVPGIDEYRTMPVQVPGTHQGDIPTVAGRPTIFVQIASYRDTETQFTLQDMFAKARFPERVFVGLCWQFDPEIDQACFQLPYPRPEQIRVSAWHWRESGGVCWARAEAQQLYRGETFVLMIDAHMRFVEHWDEKMIADLARCDSPKPVISCHPAAYIPPDKLAENPRPTILRAHPFNEAGEFRCRGEFLDVVPPKPLPGAFLAAGFVFSRGSLVREVPYDPHMYFSQEEISLAVRMFTHGWDIFSASGVFLYHYYVKPGEKSTLHWSDHLDWGRLNRLGQTRINHLLGYETSNDSQILQGLTRHGLGGQRTLLDYQTHSGVDFKNRIVTDQGLRCGFIPDLPLYRRNPIFIGEIDKELAQTPAFVQQVRASTEPPKSDVPSGPGPLTVPPLTPPRFQVRMVRSLQATPDTASPEFVDDRNATDRMAHNLHGLKRKTISVVEVNPHAPLNFVFSEAASMLVLAIRMSGLACQRLVNQVDPDGLNIVLGANPKTVLLKQVAQENLVIFNFEQLGAPSSVADDVYIEWLLKHRVFDYHQANTAYLLSRGADPTDCHEIAFLPTLIQTPNVAVPEKVNDVVFFGTRSKRRDAILDALVQSGLKLEVVQGLYGDSLVPAILRARLALHIHYYETALFPVLRVARAVMLGVPVVSEVSRFSPMSDWSQSGVIFSDYDQLVDTCHRCLASTELTFGVSRSLGFVSQIPFAESLTKALQSLRVDASLGLAGAK